ncbi:MAG: protein-L-isoaspartate O-methyltransferase [Pseudomonadota bacterium]
MIDFHAARTAMVDSQVRPSDVTQYPIIEAMLATPREEFVPGAQKDIAYVGEHLPFDEGRVLLDPRVFSKMLSELQVTPSDLVLDIGSGYGYSSAVLARLSAAVVAVESDAQAAREAAASLDAQEITTVILHTGPLEGGAPEHGPYDAVMFQGAIAHMPDSLADQIRDGGRAIAIFQDDALGQVRFGRKIGGALVWNTMFDATAPILPGFEAKAEFRF